MISWICVILMWFIIVAAGMAGMPGWWLMAIGGAVVSLLALWEY